MVNSQLDLTMHTSNSLRIRVHVSLLVLKQYSNALFKEYQVSMYGTSMVGDGTAWN